MSLGVDGDSLCLMHFDDIYSYMYLFELQFSRNLDRKSVLL